MFPQAKDLHSKLVNKRRSVYDGWRRQMQGRSVEARARIIFEHSEKEQDSPFSQVDHNSISIRIPTFDLDDPHAVQEVGRNLAEAGYTVRVDVNDLGHEFLFAKYEVPS